MHYISNAIRATFNQMVVFFGGFILLSVIMWFVSQSIRGRCGDKFGGGYYYFAAPGIVCHETGHAVGCLLTRTRIVKFVPFSPQEDGTLGYVQYEEPKSLLGKISYILISTGPIWFGCILIMLLGRLLLGASFRPVFEYLKYVVSSSGPISIPHFASIVFKAAVRMLNELTSCAKGHLLKTVLFCYLVFCIVSEMTMSSADLVCCWRGTVVLILVMFISNLLLGAVWNITALFSRVVPYLAVAYAVLTLVLVIDIAGMLLVKVLVRV